MKFAIGFKADLMLSYTLTEPPTNELVLYRPYMVVVAIKLV